MRSQLEGKCQISVRKLIDDGYITLSTFIIPSIWSPWMSIGLASLGMVYVMYKIGEKVKSKYFGLLLALIAAVSPAQVLSSMQLQQHALIGFLASFALLLLLILIKFPTRKWVIFVWGFVLGFSINTHFQSAGLLTLPLLYALIYRRVRFIPWFFLGLFTSMIPILLFELNNHWFNARNILDYIFIGQYRIWTSNRWLSFAGTFIPEFWSYVTGLPVIVTRTIMVALSFVTIFRILRKSVSREWFLIIASFLVQIIMLRYYRGEKFFGYLQFFHPYLFLFTGYVLYKLTKRWKNPAVSIVFVSATLLLILPKTWDNMKDDAFNRETTVRMETVIQAFPNTKFSTYKCEDIYDTSRVQGLLVLLYMNKLYDPNGRKITIANLNCPLEYAYLLSKEVVDINDIDIKQLTQFKLEQVTPLAVWADTARWWFTEQP